MIIAFAILTWFCFGLAGTALQLSDWAEQFKMIRVDDLVFHIPFSILGPINLAVGIFMIMPTLYNGRKILWMQK